MSGKTMESERAHVESSQHDYLARFQVTKISWRGKYERIFAITKESFCTLDPKDLRVTNEWQFRKITLIEPDPTNLDDLSITLQGSKKTETLKLKCPYRTFLISSLLRIQTGFLVSKNLVNPDSKIVRFQSKKWMRCDQVKDCLLEVGVDAIYQRASDGLLLSRYDYNHLEGLHTTSDHQEGLIIDHSERQRMFFIVDIEKFISTVQQMLMAIGTKINVEHHKTTTLAFKKARSHYDFKQETLAKFEVKKRTPRHKECIDRYLAITPLGILERDLASFVVSFRSLSSIYAIVQHVGSVQAFDLEYTDATRRTYFSLTREEIIVFIMDACHSIGNTNVVLTNTIVPAAYRFIPRFATNDVVENTFSLGGISTEVLLLQRIGNSSRRISKTPMIHRISNPNQWGNGANRKSTDLMMIIEEFNANVAPTGIAVTIKQNHVVEAMKEVFFELSYITITDDLSRKRAVSILQCLSRLAASLHSVKELANFNVYLDAILRMTESMDSVILYWSLGLLRVLLRNENDGDLLSSNTILRIVGLLDTKLPGSTSYRIRHVAMLSLCSLLEDYLNSGHCFGLVLQELTKRYKILICILLEFPSPSIVECLASLIKSILECNDPVVALSIHDGSFKGELKTLHPLRFVNQYYNMISPEIDSNSGQTLSINLRESKKSIAFQLRCRLRNCFLNEISRLQEGISSDYFHFSTISFRCSKQTRRDFQVDCTLEIGKNAILQRNAEGNLLGRYELRNIQGLRYTADEHCGIIITYNGRGRLFFSSSRENLIKTLIQSAAWIGIQLSLSPSITTDEFKIERQMVHVEQTAVAEYSVYKHTWKSKKPVLRVLRFSHDNLMEYDLEGNVSSTNEDDRRSRGSIVSLHPFVSVYSVIRTENDPHGFQIEYNDGSRRHYGSEERDCIIASILDACRSVHNSMVLLGCTKTQLGITLLPRFNLTSSEERAFYFRETNASVYFIKKIVASRKSNMKAGHESDAKVIDAVEEFIGNVALKDITVHFKGGKKEPLLMDVLGILSKMLHDYSRADPQVPRITLRLLQAFHRLSCTDTGMKEIPKMPGFVESLYRIVKYGNEITISSAISVIHACSTPLIEEQRNRETEIANKKIILSNSELVEALISLFEENQSGSGNTESAGPLILMSLSVFIESLLYGSRDTTPPDEFPKLLKLISDRYQSLLRVLLRFQNAATVGSCTLLMKTVMEESDVSVGVSIRDAALNEGLVLRHIYQGIFDPSINQRMISTYLVGLWMVDHPPSKSLLERILPGGITRLLTSTKMDEEENENLNSTHHLETKDDMFCDLKKDTKKTTERILNNRNTERIVRKKGEMGRTIEEENLEDLDIEEDMQTDIDLKNSQGEKTSVSSQEIQPPDHRQHKRSPHKIKETRTTNDHFVMKSDPLLKQGNHRMNRLNEAKRFDKNVSSQRDSFSLPTSPPSSRGGGGGGAKVSRIYKLFHSKHSRKPSSSSSRSRAHRSSRNSMGVNSDHSNGSSFRSSNSKGFSNSKWRLQKEFRTSPEKSYQILFKKLGEDHTLPDFIWNAMTREELRVSLEKGLKELDTEQSQSRIKLAWNHSEFVVHYPSLKNEIKVGDFYLKYLLEKQPCDFQLESPSRFMHNLYHRVLKDRKEIEKNTQSTVYCLRSMTLVYKFHAKTIGLFDDTPFLIQMMREARHGDILMSLLELLQQLTSQRANASMILKFDDVHFLVELVSMIHTKDMTQDHRHHLTTSVKEGNTTLNHQIPPPTTIIKAIPSWYIKNDSRGPYNVFQCKELYEKGAITEKTEIRSTSSLSSSSSSSQMFSLLDKEKTTSMTTMNMMHTTTMTTSSTTPTSQTSEMWFKISDTLQMRWKLLLSGKISYLAAAQSCMIILTHLISIHKSTTLSGLPIRPIPSIKTYISSNELLPHIVQLLLSEDEKIVQGACRLLTKTMEHNPRMNQFYRTGVFFMVFYNHFTDFVDFAALLRSTHRIHSTTTTSHSSSHSSNHLSESHLSESHLNGLLPYGMLHLLDTAKIDEFARVYNEGQISPNIIWTKEMREYLQSHVRDHLEDIVHRLTEDKNVCYQYIPIPEIRYPELSEELWCGKYYLGQLCSVEDWIIEEPVKFLWKLLDEWKQQNSRISNKFSTSKGLQFLQCTKKKRSYQDICQRYRTMAKVAQSEHEIHDLHLAYLAATAPREVLNDGTPDSVNVALILRTQILLYSRYAVPLSPFKYEGYSLLVDLLVHLNTTTNASTSSSTFGLSLSFSSSLMSSSTSFTNLSTTTLELLNLGAHLVYITCLVSPRNFDELVQESGVQILASLLERYVGWANASINKKTNHHKKTVTTTSSTSTMTTDNDTSMMMTVMEHLLYTLSGIASIDAGRMALLEIPYFTNVIVQCLTFKQYPIVRQYALKGIAAFATNETLRNSAVDSGIVWHLLKLLFKYNMSISEDVIEVQDVGSLRDNREVGNYLAVMAVKILAEYCENSNKTENYGDKEHEEGTTRQNDNNPLNHSNEILKGVLMSLLTPPLYEQLIHSTPHTFLRSFINTTESPILFWNEAMRKELLTFIEMHLQNWKNEKSFNYHEVQAFRYNVLKFEGQVGGIYLRIYDENPSFFFSKQVVESLTTNLFKFLVGESGEEFTVPYAGWGLLHESMLHARRIRALRCVSHLAYNYKEDFEEVASRNKSFDIIFQYLLPYPEQSLSEYEILRDHALSILENIAGRRIATNAIVSHNLLWKLVRVAQRLDGTELKAINCLSKMCLISSAVHAILESTLLLDILSFFIQSFDYFEESEFTAAENLRIPAAQIISALLNDSSHGERAESLISQFMPYAIVATIRENPLKGIAIFDDTTIDPEIIWNDRTRDHLRQQFSRVMTQSMEVGMPSPIDAKLVQFNINYQELLNEVFIGDMYIKRYLADPSFPVRNPTRVVLELFEAFFKECAKEIPAFSRKSASSTRKDTNGSSESQKGELMRLVTSTIVCIIRRYPEKTDRVGDRRIPEKLSETLLLCQSEKAIGLPQICCLRLVQVLSRSPECVNRMSSKCIIQAVAAPLLRHHRYSAFILDTLRSVIENYPRSNGENNVVLIANKLQLVPWLMALIRRGGHSSEVEIRDPQETKIHAIEVIKLLEKDPTHGGKVTEVLKQWPDWTSDFKTMQYDLKKASIEHDDYFLKRDLETTTVYDEPNIHPTSSQLHPTSSQLHPTSSQLHPTSSQLHPTTSQHQMEHSQHRQLEQQFNLYLQQQQQHLEQQQQAFRNARLDHLEIYSVCTATTFETETSVIDNESDGNDLNS